MATSTTECHLSFLPKRLFFFVTRSEGYITPEQGLFTRRHANLEYFLRNYSIYGDIVLRLYVLLQISRRAIVCSGLEFDQSEGDGLRL